MNPRLQFSIFCIEEYKVAKRKSGQQVAELFKEYNVLGYLRECYDALHTIGPAALVADIDAFILSRKRLK